LGGLQDDHGSTFGVVSGNQRSEQALTVQWSTFSLFFGLETAENRFKPAKS
jgi:hypothetical protein